MEKRKNPFSIKVIYWLTQVIFWLFVLILVGAIVLNMGLQTGWFGDDLELHAGTPIEFNYTEKGVLQVAHVSQEVEFVEATGKIHFINTNKIIAKWLGLAMLCVVIIFLYILLKFKNFIVNVYKGIVFERYNIRMLKHMAYGLVAIWLFINIYGRLFYYFIAKQLVFEHLEVTSNFDSYGGILIAALFLWVLSHIFMQGVTLQEEQELTV
jgi:hypothetical protein